MMPFTEIPKDKWPDVGPERAVRERALRNDTFLVQVFTEANGMSRMSVNVVKQRHGVWVDGITWDQLQEIKRLIGYGNLCAVEIYPPDQHVVRVANMRHLWLLADPPPFMWHNAIIPLP
jgi:hypothetical protein